MVTHCLNTKNSSFLGDDQVYLEYFILGTVLPNMMEKKRKLTNKVIGTLQFQSL